MACSCIWANSGLYKRQHKWEFVRVWSAGKNARKSAVLKLESNDSIKSKLLIEKQLQGPSYRYQHFFGAVSQLLTSGGANPRPVRERGSRFMLWDCPLALTGWIGKLGEMGGCLTCSNANMGHTFQTIPTYLFFVRRPSKFTGTVQMTRWVLVLFRL